MQDASPDNSPTVDGSPTPPAVVDGSPDPSTPPDRRSPVSVRTSPASRRRPDYSTASITVRDLALVALQLALATIFVWQFELEHQRHLHWGMLAVLGGLLVNVHLPARFRPAWFLAISVAVLIAVLGWSDGRFALS